MEQTLNRGPRTRSPALSGLPWGTDPGCQRPAGPPLSNGKVTKHRLKGAADGNSASGLLYQPRVASRN